MFKTKREARLSDFEHPMHSVCTTLLREVRRHLSSTNKKCFFSLYCVRFALLCFAKLGGTSAVQIKKMLFFFVLFFAKLGCGSEVKIKVFSTFILYFAHLALTFTVCKLGCTSAVQIKKMLFFFVLRSVCTNFASKLEYWFLSVYMHLIATLQISKLHTPIT